MRTATKSVAVSVRYRVEKVDQEMSKVFIRLRMTERLTYRCTEYMALYRLLGRWIL